MAFLRSVNTTESLPVIRADGIWLRPPNLSDYALWAELRAQSRVHLTKWEPAWSRDELSKTGFRRRLRHHQREARDDQGYAFLIFSTGNDGLVGGLTLSNVRRGVCQSAMLGYWLGLPHVGNGYMTGAVRAIFPYVFDVLKLHRIEAATQPDNDSSVAVLERNGFECEGRLKRYLKIGGRWQDHMLYALVEEEFRVRRQPSA